MADKGLATDNEIQTALAELPGWKRQNNSLQKTFDLKGFKAAMAFADPADLLWAASVEAGGRRVPAAAAASDETVACGEGAAAGDEKARGPEEVAAAGARRVDSTSPIQLEASLNVAGSYAVAG